MSKFKVGDRVRRSNGSWGTIVEVRTNGWYKVWFDGQQGPGKVHVNAMEKVG